MAAEKLSLCFPVCVRDKTCLLEHIPKLSPPTYLLLQVALSAKKSKFSVAMDGQSVSISGTVKPSGSFITRIGSFDVVSYLRVTPYTC